jgi:hypothetical protein
MSLTNCVVGQTSMADWAIFVVFAAVNSIILARFVTR